MLPCAASPTLLARNLIEVSYPLENALYQWEEGWRSYQTLAGDPLVRRRADRVVAAVRDELQRRLGPTFRAADLADLYGRGTDWCEQVALEVDSGPGLDAQLLADAAFWLYLRGAADFAGGCLLALD
jgi:hypothetical protein